MKRVTSLTKPARASRVGETAFTRLELLAVVAALVLLAGVVLPALAQGKPRAQQAICFNNLRMMGQAILLFNAENGQMDPWRTPGVGYNHPLTSNPWFQFSWLSNGLTNPKVLACPSDNSVRPAKDYSFSPDGGYFNANYRNAAISYFAGADSSALLPDSILSGDRNIEFQGLSPCTIGSGIFPTFEAPPQASPLTSWLKGLHAPFGNILLHDGRVEETTSQTIQRNFQRSDDNTFVHLLIPPRVS